jgi:hypothetical protein
MPGLDPGIHLQKEMDCRVKPGNDDWKCFRQHQTPWLISEPGGHANKNTGSMAGVLILETRDYSAAVAASAGVLLPAP